MDRIINQVIDELNRADKKYAHDPMIHMKVGLKTIHAEFVELEREVEKFDYACGDVDHLEREAVQVAAMSLKFLRDIVTPMVVGTMRREQASS